MDRAEVIQWRKAERQRLIAERLGIPGDIRRDHVNQIAAKLDEVIGESTGGLSAPLGLFAVSRTYVAL